MEWTVYPGLLYAMKSNNMICIPVQATLMPTITPLTHSHQQDQTQSIGQSMESAICLKPLVTESTIVSHVCASINP